MKHLCSRVMALLVVLLTTASLSSNAQVILFSETFDTDLGQFTNNNLADHLCGDGWVQNTGIVADGAAYASSWQNSTACAAQTYIVNTNGIDASASTNLELKFDHQFSPWSVDTAQVLIWDGQAWNLLAEYTTDVATLTNVTFDITQYANSFLAVAFFYWGNDGNYWVVDNVVVTDHSATGSPCNLTGSAAVLSNVSTNGGNDGSANATASGNNNAVSYLWTPSNQTSATASNLSAGIYTVLMQDGTDASCTVTAQVTISEPGGSTPCNLNLQVTGTNVTTNGGSDGTALATASGAGNPNYLWSNGIANDQLVNLTAGIYSVTCTDLDNVTCTGIATITITEPGGGASCNLDVTASGTNVTANGGSDGTATASMTGASSISYLWSTGATSATISNLTAGTYSVTGTDVNNLTCTDVATIVITEPDANGCALTLDVTTVNSTAQGANDGSASAYEGGNNFNVTYLWNGPNNYTGIGQTVTDLAPGAYTCIITEQTTACQAIVSFTIYECALNLIVNTTDEDCGQDDGSIQLAVQNGNGNLSYSWSNGASDEDLDNLSVGSYTVEVTDAQGCTATSTATVGGIDINTLSATITGTDPTSCGASDATATVVASGGQGGSYSYSWSDYTNGSNAGNTQTISSLGLGYYICEVSDGTCTLDAMSTQGHMVQDPGAPTVSVTAQQVTCNGDGDGSANAIVTGGSQPFTYEWAHIDDDQNVSSVNSTAATLTNLSGGTYVVTVSDASGCRALEGSYVWEPEVITVDIAVTNATTFGGSNGSAVATPSGGNGSWSYSWSNGGASASTGNLSDGTTYTVNVTDMNGCTGSGSALVQGPVAVASIMSNDTDFLVYPNPNEGRFTVVADQSSTQVAIYNTVGQLVKQINLNGRTMISVSLEDVDTGIYFVKTGENMQKVQKVIVR